MIKWHLAVRSQDATNWRPLSPTSPTVAAKSAKIMKRPSLEPVFDLSIPGYCRNMATRSSWSPHTGPLSCNKLNIVEMWLILLNSVIELYSAQSDPILELNLRAQQEATPRFSCNHEIKDLLPLAKTIPCTHLTLTIVPYSLCYCHGTRLYWLRSRNSYVYECVTGWIMCMKIWKRCWCDWD